jgi:hypothetical protein
MYEIIGYYKKRDRSIRYDVLFSDCEDPVGFDETEMMGMLKDSLYLPQYKFIKSFYIMHPIDIQRSRAANSLDRHHCPASLVIHGFTYYATVPSAPILRSVRRT